MIFKRWAKAIDCHHIVARLHAKPMHKRDANAANPSARVKLLVNQKLVLQGMRHTFHLLEFEDDIIPGDLR